MKQTPNSRTTGSPVVRILREEGLLSTPHIADLSGPCDSKGRYDLRISTFGRLRSKHLRNIIKQLDLQANILEDDEAREVAADAQP